MFIHLLLSLQVFTFSPKLKQLCCSLYVDNKNFSRLTLHFDLNLVILHLSSNDQQSSAFSVIGSPEHIPLS